MLRSFATALAVVCLLVLLSSSALAAPRLFGPLRPDVGPPTGTPARASARMDVNVDALMHAAAFEIELTDGRVVLADLKGKAVRGNKDLTWKGRLVGAAPGHGDVVIPRRGPWVSGAIFTAGGTFQIEPVPGGDHRLVELDSAAFPACDGALPARASPPGPSRSPRAAAPSAT